MVNMENAEEVMQILDRFTRLKQKEIPKELDEYLQYVAKTGDTVFKWSSLKYLFREKLLNVIKHFHDTTPRVDEIPQYPNVDPFNYENMKSSLLERLELFNAAPFTIQRLCELLIDPRKQYSRIDKFMRALEKNILVVSTIEPGRKRTESENGDSLDSVVNGDLSLDVNVDIDMDNEGLFNMETQNGNGNGNGTSAATGNGSAVGEVTSDADADADTAVVTLEVVKEKEAALKHSADDDILPNPKKAKLDLAEDGDEEEQKKKHEQEGEIKPEKEKEQKQQEQEQEQAQDRAEEHKSEAAAVDTIDADTEAAGKPKVAVEEPVQDSEKVTVDVGEATSVGGGDEEELKDDDEELKEVQEKNITLKEMEEQASNEEKEKEKPGDEQAEKSVGEVGEVEKASDEKKEKTAVEKGVAVEKDLNSIPAAVAEKKETEVNEDAVIAACQAVVEYKNRAVVKVDVDGDEKMSEEKTTSKQAINKGENGEKEDKETGADTKVEKKGEEAAAQNNTKGDKVVDAVSEAKEKEKGDEKAAVAESNASKVEANIPQDVADSAGTKSAETVAATDPKSGDAAAVEVEAAAVIKGEEAAADAKISTTAETSQINKKTENLGQPQEKTANDDEPTKNLSKEEEKETKMMNKVAPSDLESGQQSQKEQTPTATASTTTPVKAATATTAAVSSSIVEELSAVSDGSGPPSTGVVADGASEAAAAAAAAEAVPSVAPIPTTAPTAVTPTPTPTLALNDQPMEEVSPPSIVEEVVMAESGSATEMATDVNEAKAEDEPAGMEVDDTSQEAMDQ